MIIRLKTSIITPTKHFRLDLVNIARDGLICRFPASSKNLSRVNYVSPIFAGLPRDIARKTVNSGTCGIVRDLGAREFQVDHLVDTCSPEYSMKLGLLISFY